MTNNEFIQYVQQHIREYLPPGLADAKISVSTIVHTNDDSYTGICLIRPDRNVGREIPLEEYADDVRAGQPLEDAMISIAEELTRSKVPHGVPDGSVDFTNFEDVRQNLTTKLCDPQDSVRYLSDKPWTPVGDWGLLYRVKMGQGEGLVGSAPITNTMMEIWKIDLPTLHRAAVDNESSKDPAWLTSNADIFAGHFIAGPNNLLDGGPRMLRPTDSFMLSNKSHFNGACVVGWDGVLEKLGDVLGRNYYILPSSIHEVMIFPDFPSRRLEQMEASLRMGNSDPRVCEQEDILSNRMQYYDRRRHRLAAPPRKFRL